MQLLASHCSSTKRKAHNSTSIFYIKDNIDIKGNLKRRGGNSFSSVSDNFNSGFRENNNRGSSMIDINRIIHNQLCITISLRFESCKHTYVMIITILYFFLRSVCSKNFINYFLRITILFFNSYFESCKLKVWLNCEFRRTQLSKNLA